MVITKQTYLYNGYLIVIYTYGGVLYKASFVNRDGIKYVCPSIYTTVNEARSNALEQIDKIVDVDKLPTEIDRVQLK
jgi:hypothetical protein